MSPQMTFHGAHSPETLSAAAQPLLDTCRAVVEGIAAPDEALPQMTLSIALQATVHAAANAPGALRIQDVISAFAGAYGTFVCGETVDPRERLALVEGDFVEAARRFLIAKAADEGGAS